MNSRILVVDDEESIRYTFEVFLSDEGHAVACAGSYSEALALVAETRFDLIYADIIMENGTGIDLLKAVRQIYPELPVIMITGMPRVETATDALRNGAMDYIVKPILQDDLVRSVRTALKRKELSDEKEKCRRNFEAIFRSVKDGIITIDGNLAVTEINQAACRICGIARAEVLDAPFPPRAGRCRGGCVEVLNEVFEQRKATKVRNIECRSNKETHQVVSLTAYPLLGRDEKFSGAVLVVRDQTRMVSLERKLRDKNALVGHSEEMCKVQCMIDDLAGVNSTVLVSGETGTGKELVVEELHRRGSRCHKPLVKVNCAALSENLLESELFGHVAGAFTGAVKDKAGRFQRADGGTLFLDEIGEISGRIQLRLLRFLETMEFERVGDATTIRVDVRVVTATNQNLKQKVADGEFRKDLFYRLKIMEIILPPLRRRREDIPLLVDHFLDLFNRKFHKSIRDITTDARQLFNSYSWPGNVRELRNIIEHAVVRCHEEVIGMRHLPMEMMKLQKEIQPPQVQHTEDEALVIRHSLNQARWNKSKAAELMGISRRTIYRKMQKYRIPSS
ncbi:MAG: Fis family transcriptional regulator [Desulfatitalea sp. BRH_c12]|nr:MAG: Fis family transcriptional regulator [Desulfatitalea sp. BRH_c12]